MEMQIARRQQLKGGSEERDVERERQNVPADGGDGAEFTPEFPGGCDRDGYAGGDEDAGADQREESQATQPRLDGIGLLIARYAVHLVERGLRRLHHAETAVQRAENADRERYAAAVKAVDVAGQLVGDPGKLAERGVDQVLP